MTYGAPRLVCCTCGEVPLCCCDVAAPLVRAAMICAGVAGITGFPQLHSNMVAKESSDGSTVVALPQLEHMNAYHAHGNPNPPKWERHSRFLAIFRLFRMPSRQDKEGGWISDPSSTEAQAKGLLTKNHDFDFTPKIRERCNMFVSRRACTPGCRRSLPCRPAALHRRCACK